MRGLVIADYQSGRLIADFRPRDIFEEDWKTPSKDDLASAERMRLVAVGTEYRSLNLVMRLEKTSNEFKFFQVMLRTDRLAKHALGKLSHYYYHYIIVISKDNFIQILIAEKGPTGGLINKFSVEFRLNMVYEGLRIVDYERKHIIAEISSHPSLNAIWTEPSHEPDTFGIVGLLTSGNSDTKPEALELITQFDLTWNLYLSIYETMLLEPETYVWWLLFPTVHDAEIARKLLGPLVGLSRVGMNWDNDKKILEILLLDKESVGCITKTTSAI